MLGDHGRHEVVGSTEDERWLGHHLTPLFVWMDPASRAAAGFRPRRVDIVASQVDVGPTILGLLGLTPRVSPFLGKDLHCLLVSDCRLEHRAMVFTGHSAAVVEQGRILRYELESGLVRETDLAGGNGRVVDPAEPEVAKRLARLQAMLVASTRVLAQNRVWSWQHLGPTLANVRAPR